MENEIMSVKTFDAMEDKKSKVKLELIPGSAMISMARALEFGAEKHGGAYNWRNGRSDMHYMTYLGALMRHIEDLKDGQDVASDSGVHHLGHIMAGCAILIDCIQLKIAIDDRPECGPAPYLLDNNKQTQ